MSAPKKEIYHNCKVLSPNGIEMFRCHKKKFDWYVRKGLAVHVDPNTIKLLFEPNGLGWAGDHYYLQDRDNKCCCCGSEDELTKHHVVPYAYRKCLPEELKDSNYYDVLPLCLSCHEAYEVFARLKKKELAERYNAPIDGINNISEFNGPILANTLLKFGDKIPEDRKNKMLAIIKEQHGEQDLKEVAKLKAKGRQRTDYKSHAEIVVSSLPSYQDFFREWREHFVSTMKPKHLPKHWSVERDSHGRKRSGKSKSKKC